MVSLTAVGAAPTDANMPLFPPPPPHTHTHTAPFPVLLPQSCSKRCCEAKPELGLGISLLFSWLCCKKDKMSPWLSLLVSFAVCSCLTAQPAEELITASKYWEAPVSVKNPKMWLIIVLFLCVCVCVRVLLVRRTNRHIKVLHFSLSEMWLWNNKCPFCFAQIWAF